jgi:Asp-tRNA(Asn)/Glu-tRNA(Gln) amidotransferase A subunit family amidase
MFLRSSPLAPTVLALRSGQLDLLTFINTTCDHIEATEPVLQALLPEPKRRARLLAQAEILQERFADPARRPALYGVLLGVKDIFHVDGFATRAGSQLDPSLFTGPEASCVTALREAGALILGKTVTTEFAYFEPGPTRNPHNIAHTPGGSSSGSAAAVAAGFCPLALGTQTIGSVIRPAAFCGIVGFKPSYGRVPFDGVIPCASSIDTIGFFTQDGAGIELVASLLCSQWRLAGVVHKPILGVPDGPYLEQVSNEGRQAFTEQLSRLEQAGYTIHHVSVMSDIEEITHRHQRLVAAEIAEVHKPWFDVCASLYRPRTAELLREGQEVSAEERAMALAGCRKLRSELEMAMQQHGLDAWVCPATTGPAPEGLASTGSPLMNLPWTHAGMPVITVPAGKADNGLPLGLQLVAATMADEQLVAWATDIAGIFSSTFSN